MLEKSSRKRTFQFHLFAMAMILAFGLRADEGPKEISALEMLDQLLETQDLQLIRIGDTQIGGVVPIRLFSL